MKRVGPQWTLSETQRTLLSPNKLHSYPIHPVLSRVHTNIFKSITDKVLPNYFPDPGLQFKKPFPEWNHFGPKKRSLLRLLSRSWGPRLVPWSTTSKSRSRTVAEYNNSEPPNKKYLSNPSPTKYSLSVTIPSTHFQYNGSCNIRPKNYSITFHNYNKQKKTAVSNEYAEKKGCRLPRLNKNVRLSQTKKMSSVKVNITFEEFNKNANQFIEISNKLNDNWNYILNVSLNMNKIF